MNTATPLELRRSDLCEILDAVVSTMLDSHVTPMPEGSHAANFSATDTWNAHVKISGAFTGVIVLTCTRQFAHHAAKSIFKEAEPLDEEATDALAELTNVTGGNVKCLVSTLVGSTCELSLPEVGRGAYSAGGARQLTELWATCEGYELGVSVLAA